MYRTAGPGAPLPEDPLQLVPGEGLRGIRVGGATPADVLRVFGSDAQVHRYADGDIFSIDYDSDEHAAYLPGRPAQAARPSDFGFEFGLLKRIDVGVYQHALRTVGGLRIGSRRAEVVDVLGRDFTALRASHGETLRYVSRGIALVIGEAGTVSQFIIFRAQRGASP